MAFKLFVALCALSVSAVMGQTACGNIGYGSLGNAGLYSNNLGLAGGCGGLAIPVASASGGAFPVISGSPISPQGLAAYSENGIEGVLAINGNLPFASAVALEGNLPTAGQAGINYGCGSSVGLNSVGNGVGLAGSGLGLTGNYGGLNLGGYGLSSCGCGL